MVIPDSMGWILDCLYLQSCDSAWSMHNFESRSFHLYVSTPYIDANLLWPGQAMILECLRVRTRERLGDVLSEFWSERSMENLRRVMEETQTRLRSERRWYEELAQRPDSEGNLKD
jgi:hypothetical protein